MLYVITFPIETAQVLPIAYLEAVSRQLFYRHCYKIYKKFDWCFS